MNLTRTELRKKIMTILYQINVYENNKIQYFIDDVIRDVIEIENEFVKDMVYGVINKKNELEEIANKYLNGWKLNRLGNTDQAIILMGIYELKYTNTPSIVVIDECLNLARDFSDEKVKDMINALLDKFYHEELEDAK